MAIAYINGISIHAPRVGRDGAQKLRGGYHYDFNPRAPCGARLSCGSHQHRHRHFNPRAPCGARPATAQQRPAQAAFQSTRPVWGATCSLPRKSWVSIYFNPRAPCGARHEICPFAFGRHSISIHAPRVGRDCLPAVYLWAWVVISIHAPRVGRDETKRKKKGAKKYFNPRAPCGARQQI